MRRSVFRLLAACVVAGCLASTLHAGQITAPLLVQVTVVRSCAVSVSATAAGILSVACVRGAHEGIVIESEGRVAATRTEHRTAGLVRIDVPVPVAQEVVRPGVANRVLTIQF
jgi:hypothetical protein